ncbi:MAG: phage major capsid protein [Nitrosopumilus sp.]
MAEPVLIKKEDLETIVGEKLTKSLEGINKEVMDGKLSKEEASTQLEELKKNIEADYEKKIKEAVDAKLAVRKTQEIKGITDQTEDIFKSVDGKVNLNETRNTVESIIQKSKVINPNVVQTDWEKDLSRYALPVAILKSVLKNKGILDTIGKYDMYKNYISHLSKAGTQWDGTTNDGVELIPTILSNTVIEDILALGGLFSIIPRMTVPVNFEVPRLDDQMAFFNVGQLVAPTASTPATKKATFAAQKIIGNAPLSYEQDQDSIVASVALLLSALPKNFDGVIEQLLISGDNAGTHQDADIEAVANHSAKAFDGLRRICLDNTWTNAISGNFIANSIRDMQAALAARSGFSFENLFWLFGQNTMTQARQIASVRTQDAFGNAATNLGRLAMLDGSNVLGSEFMREDTNSAGVNATTTAGATKASCLLFDRRAFMIGQIAPLMVETDRVITTQKIDIVLSMRLDMKLVWSTAKRPASLGIDITKV